jgi:hypothetical protein
MTDPRSRFAQLLRTQTRSGWISFGALHTIPLQLYVRQLGRRASEAESEKAARGSDGRFCQPACYNTEAGLLFASETVAFSGVGSGTDTSSVTGAVLVPRPRPLPVNYCCAEQRFVPPPQQRNVRLQVAPVVNAMR